MSEQIRRPTGDQDVNCTPYPGAPNYGNVDEVVADDNDYNSHAYEDDNETDMFDFSAFSVEGTASLIIVRVYVRAKITDDLNGIQLYGMLKVGGVACHAAGYAAALTTDWVEYMFEWPINPRTYNPWTVDEVNGIGDNHIEGIGYILGILVT